MERGLRENIERTERGRREQIESQRRKIQEEETARLQRLAAEEARRRRHVKLHLNEREMANRRAHILTAEHLHTTRQNCAKALLAKKSKTDKVVRMNQQQHAVKMQMWQEENKRREEGVQRCARVCMCACLCACLHVCVCACMRVTVHAYV